MNQTAAPLPRQRPLAPRPHRFVRRLTLLYAAAVLVMLLPLLIALLPDAVLPAAHALVAEAIRGGLAATAPASELGPPPIPSAGTVPASSATMPPVPAAPPDSGGGPRGGMAGMPMMPPGAMASAR